MEQPRLRSRSNSPVPHQEEFYAGVASLGLGEANNSALDSSSYYRVALGCSRVMTKLTGLSNAAKVGIGLGISIGVFLAATLAFGCFCLQRRKRQQQNNAAEYSPCRQQLDSQNDEGGKRQNQTMSLSSWASIAMDSWYYETIALCFSIACFMATICVLEVYNQQSTPQFSYGLTLNTVILVLATASKSSLIFVVGECIGELKWIWFRDVLEPLSNLQAYDSASREPWGSILILLNDKGRSLVSIGALITVLALAYDPFVQQISDLPLRQLHLAHILFNGAMQQM
ncbi:uncharacterized protein N7511_006264 [Penicillium nucicola]|uniref:uncharacterized protein n=1 Tax=Penicillium nucicola TaxID=1850975 RepID=UPI0025457751|nr:uncharacterized protein N7511_006264 [Penicillium nucicola]KAJ5757570.1 hypothetical protein N7511_006264 [Penicillium nucicola]